VDAEIAMPDMMAIGRDKSVKKHEVHKTQKPEMALI
jgi:hypothetical protein